MFQELESQVWTPSSGDVVISNNTDTSIDGSSRKIVWSASGETVTISFDSVTFSSYEEISFYIAVAEQIGTDLFTVTIDGNTYTFSRDDLQFRGKWNHVLIDCTEIGATSSIVITSLVESLTIFIDYIGYRSASYDCDIDVIEALKDHINLDYDVSTTLSDDAEAGDNSISLNSTDYINDSTVLELDDGAGTIETVDLLSKDGDLSESLTNAFSSGDTVRAICPVRSAEYDNLESDPICGIVVYDYLVDKQDTVVMTKSGSKIKQYLGALGLCIYIDCTSQEKLLKMAREFNRKYGEEFTFLLDGERVDIYLDTSLYNDAMLGTNHRMAYYYKFEPQPYTYVNRAQITTFTVTVDSSEYT